MTTDTRRLRELAEAATPGPWWITENDGSVYAGPEGIDATEVGACDWRDADIVFACAANPTAVLELLDEIETWHRIAERDHGAPIETVEDLRQQLAAMIAARDEACDRAAAAYGRMLGQAAIDSVEIAELRKVGAK